MNADEKEICIYLRSWPTQFVSLVEICRRAGGKRRYRDDARWAVQPLNRLVEQGIVESDATGHFKLKSRNRPEKPKKRWMSPHIQQILEKSGKQFEGVIEIEETDEFIRYLDQPRVG